MGLAPWTCIWHFAFVACLRCSCFAAVSTSEVRIEHQNPCVIVAFESPAIFLYDPCDIWLWQKYGGLEVGDGSRYATEDEEGRTMFKGV
ncbi:hypothetical protein BDR03DRAFT_1014263 [Suillus americanus]|nr:hypothetical protein BDR03DRAFT_1014263 [Suillus americanus]